MHASQIAHEPRTFRSGAYLDSLFRAAERMDAQLQAEICARIKQARVEAGLTQPEAADLLGVTLRGYQNYESVRVPFRKLTRVAEMFGVEETWLLRGDPEPATEPGAVLLGEVVRRLQSLEDQLDRQAKETARGFRALARDVRSLAPAPDEQDPPAREA